MKLVEEKPPKLNSDWKVLWAKSVEKYYKKTTHKTKIQNIIKQISLNPHNGPNIKRLTGDLKGLHRYRFSNLRLIYQINDETKQITLVYLGTRGDSYK